MGLSASGVPKHRRSFWGNLEGSLKEVRHLLIENIETSLLVGGSYSLISLVVWYFLK